MTLQNIFYIVGTLFAVVGLLTTAVIGVGVFLLYRKFHQLTQQANQKKQDLQRALHSLPSFLRSRSFVQLIPIITAGLGFFLKQRRR